MNILRCRLCLCGHLSPPYYLYYPYYIYIRPYSRSPQNKHPRKRFSGFVSTRSTGRESFIKSSFIKSSFIKSLFSYDKTVQLVSKKSMQESSNKLLNLQTGDHGERKNLAPKKKESTDETRPPRK